MKKKTIVVAATAALVMSLGFLAIRTDTAENAGEHKEETRRALVKAVPVKVSDLEERIFSVGNVEAMAKIDVFAKVAGKIAEIRVEEGQVVKKDDVLCYVDRDIEGMKFEMAAVKTPIAGTVLRKYFDAGTQVSPGVRPLFTIANVEAVKVLVRLGEQHLLPLLV